MYAHPFLDLELTLTLIIKDDQTIKMGKTSKEFGTVNIYVERTTTKGLDYKIERSDKTK